jgi:CheY-like chemotaxis protein
MDLALARHLFTLWPHSLAWPGGWLRSGPEDTARSRLNHILLVALSGYGQADDQQRYRDAGFDRHFLKPVDVVNIQQLLAAWQAPTADVLQRVGV